MGYQVAFSPSARSDLRDFPELGRVVPEFAHPSIREIVVRSYRVIYRLDHAGRRVDIARFWHGARGNPENTGS